MLRLPDFLRKLRKAPKEHFIMHRFGQIETELTAPNQCKDVGHSTYDYVVKITCFNRLNSDGYLIDNKAINRTMKMAMTQMMSCEQLCIRFAEVLETLFNDSSVPVCELYVSLEPVVPGASFKDHAKFEFSRTYQKV